MIGGDSPVDRHLLGFFARTMGGSASERPLPNSFSFLCGHRTQTQNFFQGTRAAGGRSHERFLYIAF